MDKKIFFVLSLWAFFFISSCGEKEAFYFSTDFDEPLVGNNQWYFSATPDTCVIVEYDQTGGVASSGGIHIVSQGRTDAYVSKNLSGLDPTQLYRMSADVRTRDVSLGRGAVIYVATEDRDQKWNASEFLYGDNDWTRVYVDFYPTEEGTAVISCRLGFLEGTYNGGKAQGEVYFDNVEVMEIDTLAMYTRSSEHISLALDRDKVHVSDSVMDVWLSRLDSVYEAYSELVGAVPYGGRKLRILSTPGIEPGYWALAGNPILWNNHVGIDRCLRSIRDHDDWNFGILHEMGHTFSSDAIMDCDVWNWDDELFANFRMSYALEKCNGRVTQRDVFYHGDEISDYYKIFYDETVGAGIPKVNGDVLHYTFLRIKDHYGWSVFEQVFRQLYERKENDFPVFETPYDQFVYFLDEVSACAGEDVVKTCYTPEEMVLIKEAMSS